VGEGTVKDPISLRIDWSLFRVLYKHLFPGDQDEHGAVIAVGVSESPSGTRLLAREIFLARDGIDYVPGTKGYRALTAQFVAEKSDYCASNDLGYLAVHCHSGDAAVSFSDDDFASHQRGYPALLDITGGGPVGALVFAKRAVAGEIWIKQGVRSLSCLTVIGPRVITYYPSPAARPGRIGRTYDRQARLFGDIGQEILQSLKVGIIGLGGGGSLLSEWLSRLGVGHIVAVDFDRLNVTNLSRVVGATRRDALAFLAEGKIPQLRSIATKFARHKVDVARRVARQANPRIRFDAIRGSVLDEPVALALKDADFVFLATDSIQSRLVFNALVHQYLIPGAQIGSKVTVAQKDGAILDITVASRPVLPNPGGGCLECHELIPAGRLQQEALSESDRIGQRYVDDDVVTEPSVICLNVLSAAQVATDLMMMFTGLYNEGVNLRPTIGFVRERKFETVDSRINISCPDCSYDFRSRRARGDRRRLPCRASPLR
jgi:molybdopterin/thiamine biosynthesis adenylyltransferase